MGAYLTENPRDAQIFIQGKDIHQEKANELRITRNQSKTINLGLQYSMGKLLLASQLKLPIDKASDLVAEFWHLNPELAQFRKELRNVEAFETHFIRERMVNLVLNGR